MQMENPGSYIFLVAATLVLLFLNCLMSKDIHDWIPFLKERAGLYLLVWLLPVAGLFLANRLGALGWFARKKVGGGTGAISGGLMGLDSIFNPEAKHIIEVVEEQKAEMRQEYSRDDDKDKNPQENT